MQTCIRDGCGMPFDASLPETRPSNLLRPWWWLYCPKHRGLAEPATIVVEQPEEPEV